ncbi:MAG: 50S ribosomal protein L23 [Gemmatimonadetes bacterium]|nr:50S ribosomal protein L23 [Gemmatimonadota bacterium]
MRDPRDVLIRPVVTERSTALADAQAAYTFVVAPAANKLEIRRAVESLFGVRVIDVRTMNYRGKWRRVGRSLGRRPGYKKAVVRLAAGERIDVYEGT